MIASLITPADLAANAAVAATPTAIATTASGSTIFQLRNLLFICPPSFALPATLTTLNASEHSRERTCFHTEPSGAGVGAFTSIGAGGGAPPRPRTTA